MDLINGLLNPDRTSRMSLDEIFRHEWFHGETLSPDELKAELLAKKNTVQKQKKKEREALARKNARGRVRGGEKNDHNRSLLGPDEMPLAPPSMNFSGAFGGSPKMNMDEGMFLDPFSSFGGMDNPFQPQMVKPLPQMYDEKSNVECYTQFISECDAQTIMQNISELLESARCKFTQDNNLFEIRSSFTTQESGLLDFVAKVYRMEDGKHMVMFRRIKGDILQFRELFDEFLCEIANIVYLPPEQEE